MKMIHLFCTALLAGWLNAACTSPDPEVEPVPNAPEKGYATGKAVDTQGKPLADVEIVVNNTQFYNSNIVGRTDSKGEYKLQLTPGSWYVRGTVKVKYDNRTYVLDLHPETDGAFAGTEGAVRNLRWKLPAQSPLNSAPRATTADWWKYTATTFLTPTRWNSPWSRSAS